jgi:hypothetical protein
MLRQKVWNTSKANAIAAKKRCISSMVSAGNSQAGLLVIPKSTQQSSLSVVIPRHSNTPTTTASRAATAVRLFSSNNNNSSSDNSSNPEVILVDNVIKMKNTALAIGLIGFCISVGLYSVNAVGQAGNSSVDGSEDPLSNLRREAEAAKTDKDTKLAVERENTEVMLKQLRDSEFDPDRILDEEEAIAAAEKASKKRKKWLGIF